MFFQHYNPPGAGAPRLRRTCAVQSAATPPPSAMAAFAVLDGAQRTGGTAGRPGARAGAFTSAHPRGLLATGPLSVPQMNAAARKDLHDHVHPLECGAEVRGGPRGGCRGRRDDLGPGARRACATPGAFRRGQRKVRAVGRAISVGDARLRAAPAGGVTWAHCEHPAASVTAGLGSVPRVGDNVRPLRSQVNECKLFKWKGVSKGVVAVGSINLTPAPSRV